MKCYETSFKASELNCIQTPGKTAFASPGSHFWLYSVVATNGLAWSREGRRAFLLRSCAGVRERRAEARRQEGEKGMSNNGYKPHLLYI